MNANRHGTTHRDPAHDLPIMREHLEAAYAVADSDFLGDVLLADSDHLGFMALCFAYKQFAHARSVMLLLDAHQHIDAATIGRVMLEGLILVAWAALRPDERPLRWRAYSLVSDWKKIQAEAGAPSPELVEKKADLAKRLIEHPEFLTGGARKHGPASFPDPYQANWRLDANGSKVELRDMAAELEDPALKVLYDELSQAAHWTPRGVAIDVSSEEDRTTFAFTSATQAAMACGAAFLSLTQTAMLLHQHYRGQPHVRMQNVFDSYVRRLGSA